MSKMSEKFDLLRLISRMMREKVDLHLLWCLKKNLNAPRPSEHPPVWGKKMSKRLGGINS